MNTCEQCIHYTVTLNRFNLGRCDIDSAYAAKHYSCKHFMDKDALI